jgi:hypothetical protein
MTTYERLRELLDAFSDENHYLFTLQDLSTAFPDMDRAAIRNLASRSTKREYWNGFAAGSISIRGWFFLPDTCFTTLQPCSEHHVLPISAWNRS